MAGLPAGISPLKYITRAQVALYGKDAEMANFRALGLSPRQAEVFAILMDGKSNAEIASDLCVTQKTIKFHLTYCYKTLKVKSRGEAGEKRDPGFINGRPGSIFQAGNAGACDIQGRWPANILFDEDAAEQLDLMSGPCKTGVITRPPNHDAEKIIKGKKPFVTASHTDTAIGASRFFYVAKASKSERNRGMEGMEIHRYGAGIGQGKNPEAPTIDKNFHPTVKPTKLMEYLITLICPPNGICLDPFMGSGSTGVAAKNLKREFIGIEMNAEYHAIALKRIESA